MLEIKLNEKQVMLITLGLRSVEHRFFEYESECIEIEQLLGSTDFKVTKIIHDLVKEKKENGSIKK